LAEKKNLFERIWSFFAALKLAIVLLLLLAVTSIIGTIIEQNVEPAKNIQLLSKMFGVEAAPTIYNIFAKLGFMDMYHSWWYTTLLTLFALNLTICSLERLPKTWKLVKKSLTPLSENAMKSMPIKKETTIKTNLSIAKDEILNALRASRYNVFEANDEGGIQLYTEKGNYTRLGVYVVHCSILLILAGAIIGTRFGFDGFLNLPEGGASSYAYTRSGDPVPLGFTIKCNWYDTQYYAGTDTPREFQSELVIFEDGREVLKKQIEVNNPLKYKGFTFYQSSYGMIPDAEGEFILRVINNKGKEKILYLHNGDTFEIPGTSIKGKIIDFSPALGRDPTTGELVTYAQTMINPAVQIEFAMGEDVHNSFKGWVLRRYPETGVLPGGHKVEFIDYWGVEYTGLQVSKDPGVVIIYLASIIMCLGLYIAFFMSHRKIWVRLATERVGKGNSVRIMIAGSASKNRLALERQIEHILSRAAEAINQRQPKKK
jgi:cytochrome c biogenesis protein